LPEGCQAIAEVLTAAAATKERNRLNIIVVTLLSCFCHDRQVTGTNEEELSGEAIKGRLIEETRDKEACGRNAFKDFFLHSVHKDHGRWPQGWITLKSKRQKAVLYPC
jgi:hypothetical protein